VPVSVAAALAKNGAEGEPKMDNLVEIPSADQGREHALVLKLPDTGILYGQHGSHSSPLFSFVAPLLFLEGVWTCSHFANDAL